MSDETDGAFFRPIRDRILDMDLLFSTQGFPISAYFIFAGSNWGYVVQTKLMEVVPANSYLRQVLDLDSRRILTGNGNGGNIWAKNASFHCERAQFGKYIYLFAM